MAYQTKKKNVLGMLASASQFVIARAVGTRRGPRRRPVEWTRAVVFVLVLLLLFPSLVAAW